MEINDKIINYEIQKQLSNSASDLSGMANEKQPVDRQKADENTSARQDTVVNLSSASKEAQRIKETIASETEVREDKVAAIKEKLESGRYQIGHKAVAGKLMDAFMGEF